MSDIGGVQSLYPCPVFGIHLTLNPDLDSVKVRWQDWKSLIYMDCGVFFSMGVVARSGRKYSESE